MPEFTVTGLVVAGVAALLFFRSPYVLLLLLLISIPFSATAVLNFGEMGAGTGFAVTLFLVLVYLLRRLIQTMLSGSVRLPRVPLLVALMLFVVCMAASLYLPTFSPGLSFVGTDPRGALEATYTLGLSRETFVQLAYFLVWALWLVMVVQTLNSYPRLLQAVRVVVYTGIFVCAWGWVQVTLSVVGVAYPHFIFNNTASGSGQGYMQTLPGLSISRMSSVAVEPSVFAAFLLTLSALLLGFVLLRQPLVSSRADRWILGLFAITGLASTAATAYLGFGLITLLGLMFGLLVRGVKPTSVVLGLVALVFASFSVVSLYVGNSVVQNVVDNFLLNRAGGFSFSQRFTSVILGWEAFTSYPITGLGVASMTVYSLPFWLLANTGVVGFAAFAALYSGALYYSWFIGRTTSGPAQALSWGVMLCLVVNLVVACFTGFPYVFGHFWLPLGLAFSLSALAVFGRQGSKTPSPVG